MLCYFQDQLPFGSYWGDITCSWFWCPRVSNLRISIGGPPEKPFICSMQEKLPNFSANCSRNLANQANKQRESNQPEYHSYSQSKTKKRKTLQLINQKNQVFKYNPEVQDSPTRSIVSILVASFASDNNKHRLISFTFFHHLPPSLPRDSTHPLQQNHRGSEGSKTSLSKTKSPAKRPGTFSRWSWKVWSEGTWQSNVPWTNWTQIDVCKKNMHIKSLCLSLFLSSHVSLVLAFHFIPVLLTAYIGNASKKKKCPGKASCKGFTSSSFGSTWVPRVEAEFRRPDVSSCRDVMSSCCQCTVRHLPGWSLKLFHDVPLCMLCLYTYPCVSVFVLVSLRCNSRLREIVWRGCGLTGPLKWKSIDTTCTECRYIDTYIYN